jgi:uncharacterized RDD family membrane protein YckC
MDANPFHPPVDELPPHVGVVGEAPLATLGARFGGSVVDGIIIGIASAVLDFVIPKIGLSMFMAFGLDVIAGIVASCVVQILVFRDGQSIGKRLLRMRIVEHGSGRTASVARIIGLRILPLTLLSYASWYLAVLQYPDLAMLGAFCSLAITLADVLPIFGKERRCLHDLLAGTKVVRCG